MTVEHVPFPTALSRAVYYNKYSRWDYDLGRREKKPESIIRADSFLDKTFRSRGGIWLPDEHETILQHMHALDSLCSMRLLWSAGPALERNHVMAYNCAYMAIRRLTAFREALFILMSGTGVGYSVEYEYVDDLPKIKKQKKNDGSIRIHVVADTTEGWCDALDDGLTTWWNGEDVQFDVSLVRPAGSILRTKGGRSSGPGPLVAALKQIRQIILRSGGRKASPLLCHDIMCLLAQIVVVGGIRRAALICLSNLDDLQMRGAKHGEYWNATPWRAMANNSVAYNEKPSDDEFLDEWIALVKGKSGERGIFNRRAFRSTSPRRKKWNDVGTNPCGEINLRDEQFCNLTSIACFPNDDLYSLEEKIRCATAIGTIQASLTDFPYLGPQWKVNCEEEALLGVSATGQMDCPAFRDPQVQRALLKVAIEVNKDFAHRIGINQSVAITTSKPEGTRSLLVNTSSGAHVRWSKFGIRRMQMNDGDKMLDMFRAMGMNVQPYPLTPGTSIVDFPFKSPEGALTRHDVTAMQQLEYWKSLKLNYTEHNPSCTIYVSEGEWVQVGAWVRENWDVIGGLSFLPSDDHVYTLAPYEEITEAEYLKLMESFPNVDDDTFAEMLAALETEDNTTGSQEFACSGSSCETP